MTEDKFMAKHPELAGHVLLEAQAIWEAAGCPSDFCVQYDSGDVFVFGSTNRVQWSVRFGFRADSSCCNQGFLETFTRLFGDRRC
jgi:hypothetical protein